MTLTFEPGKEVGVEIEKVTIDASVEEDAEVKAIVAHYEGTDVSRKPPYIALATPYITPALQLNMVDCMN